MQQAIQDVTDQLRQAGRPVPLSKLRGVFAKALGRSRLADSVLQPVLREAERKGAFRLEKRGNSKKLVLMQAPTLPDDGGDELHDMPPAVAKYYAKNLGHPVYRSQAIQYMAYYKARKAAGLGACHPLLWVWGYEYPIDVTPEDKAHAKEVLSRDET